ncbi:MAG: VCBS repeat-containing protein [Planctomycetota bacterium]
MIAALSLLSLALQQPRFEPLGALELETGVAVLEVPGPTPSLLWIDRRGRVQQIVADGPQGAPLTVTEDGWTLPDADRTLVELDSLNGRVGLLTLSPRGAYWHPLEGGLPVEEGRRLARRARFGLQVGEPRLADLLVELDGQGPPELVVPGLESVGLWRLTLDDQGRLGARRELEVEVPVSVERDPVYGDLTDRLFSRLSIPGLFATDLNGDGRDDLVVVSGVRQGFHLAREDGSFATEPDREVDLSLFRDETSGTGVRPGETVTLEAGASLTRRDVNSDGVPDHVVAAGRKVWVFPSGADGPQFETPSAILKSGDDVTKALIVELDADGRPDLLLLRLEVPSIATLVRGIVFSFDVELKTNGYRNVGGGKFETRPAWSSTIEFRIPPLRDLVGDPYSLFEDLAEAAESYRILCEGDFDGDGALDLAAATEDGDAIELWLGAAAEAAQPSRELLDATLADALYGEGSKVWTFERVFSFLRARGGDRITRATGGRAPDARVALPAGSPAPERLLALPIEGGDRLIAVSGLGGERARLDAYALGRAGR